MSTPAVVFTISPMTDAAPVSRPSIAVAFPPLLSAVQLGRDSGTKLPPGRGSNQLLPKSKKQRSDQLHEVRKSMSRRKEQ